MQPPQLARRAISLDDYFLCRLGVYQVSTRVPGVQKGPRWHQCVQEIQTNEAEKEKKFRARSVRHWQMLPLFFCATHKYPTWSAVFPRCLNDKVQATASKTAILEEMRRGQLRPRSAVPRAAAPRP